MHVTLHLTNACNLTCGYCYEEHHAEYMTRETARKAVELAVSYFLAENRCFAGN